VVRIQGHDHAPLDPLPKSSVNYSMRGTRAQERASGSSASNLPLAPRR
jgi:hypothetical protein